ncbi:HNH endonuclease [Streptomyces sp. NPDC006640]|uniref:HNH endonuclease n=1 Tax=Streptomyces sp. NPDC006640 TaxID=3364754 RepID=UPI0036C8ED8B
MAVSKRLRYEILRRDNHACRYCGATAPQAKLNVDHVLPTSLGGGDEPSNLVTACSPCNSGKTSSLPNAEPVADVDQEAFRAAAESKKIAAAAAEYDPETGMPASWSFWQIQVAMVEDVWQTAWCAADPEGPSVADWEALYEQRQHLIDSGVYISNILAAAAIAGSRQTSQLAWGVSFRNFGLWPDTEAFGLGCDATSAWETAWESSTGERPPGKAVTLFVDEVTEAIKAGHLRRDLMGAAERAGRRAHFYLPAYLPERENAGGER